MGLKDFILKNYFPEYLVKRAVRSISPYEGIVLMYHEVLPDDIELPAWTIVKATDFQWQMQYLQTHFDVITLDQATKRLFDNSDFKKPFAVVTFDDGYMGNLTTALPIMESIGLPFTLYVATKAIIENNYYWYDCVINLLNTRKDFELPITQNGKVKYYKIPYRRKPGYRWRVTQRLLTHLKEMPSTERNKVVDFITTNFASNTSPLKMLTYDSLQQLAKSNCVTIGSHTHGHELLDQLETQEIQQTLQEANLNINQIVGYAPKHFAYPNGNFNENVIKQIQQAGFETAVTTIPGRWSNKNYLLKIPRVSVGRFDTKYRFKAQLSGYL